MGFMVGRKALLDAVRIAKKVIPKRTVLPLLANIRLSLAGDHLCVSATDTDQTIMIQLLGERGKSTGEFTRVLPPDSIISVLQSLEEDTIELSPEKDNRLKVDVVKINGTDPKEYPLLSLRGDKLIAEIPSAKEFAGAIQKVAFCRSAEPVRYALQGVLLDAKEDRITLVASDGKRLATQDIHARSGGGVGLLSEVKIQHKMILPSDAVDRILELSKVCPEVKVHVFAGWTETDGGQTDFVYRVSLEGYANIFGRVVDGTFPNYKAIFPDHKGDGWDIEKANLETALRKTKPIWSQLRRDVVVKMDFSEKEVMTMHAEHDEIGEAAFLVKVKGTEKMKIALNPNFIVDYLSILPKECKTIYLKAGEKDQATLWNADGVDGNSHLLMPCTYKDK